MGEQRDIKQEKVPESPEQKELHREYDSLGSVAGELKNLVDGRELDGYNPVILSEDLLIAIDPEGELLNGKRKQELSPDNINKMRAEVYAFLINASRSVMGVGERHQGGVVRDDPENLAEVLKFISYNQNIEGDLMKDNPAELKDQLQRSKEALENEEVPDEVPVEQLRDWAQDQFDTAYMILQRKIEALENLRY